MSIGAIQITYGDDAFYAVLPIHEIRGSIAIFRVEDPAERGAHLLSAADIRGSWDAWVGDLVSDDQIFTNEALAGNHKGIEIY